MTANTQFIINGKKQAGFGILEVPISLFIIAVMLLIYGAASNSMTLNRNSKEQDLGHFIAVSELEDLRALGYANLPASGAFSHPLLENLPGGTATLTVSDYNNDTKEVIVTVTWKDPGSFTIHSTVLTTLINKYGL